MKTIKELKDFEKLKKGDLFREYSGEKKFFYLGKDNELKEFFYDYNKALLGRDDYADYLEDKHCALEIDSIRVKPFTNKRLEHISLVRYSQISASLRLGSREEIVLYKKEEETSPRYREFNSKHFEHFMKMKLTALEKYKGVKTK